jgi:hypothetical protein
METFIITLALLSYKGDGIQMYLMSGRSEQQCHNDHYLVVAEVGDGLTLSKQKKT